MSNRVTVKTYMSMYEQEMPFNKNCILATPLHLTLLNQRKPDQMKSMPSILLNILLTPFIFELTRISRQRVHFLSSQRQNREKSPMCNNFVKQYTKKFAYNSS